MKRILTFLFVAIAWIAASAQISWPPASLPCKVPFTLSAEVQYYWEITQVLCTGKSGSGYKFKVTGTGRHDHQAAQVNIMYLKPGGNGQLPEAKVAGTYYLPKVEKGKMFYFDFEAAWQGMTPNRFSLFFASDMVTLPANPDWGDAPSASQKSTPQKDYGHTDGLANIGTPDLIVEDNKEIDKSLAKPVTASKKSNELEICQNPDSFAEFPGGEAAMMRFIASDLRYPEAAFQNDVQGRVIVTFVISKEGKVVNPTIHRGRDKDLDREALRIISKLPDFKPAMKNGVPVNVRMNVPINFRKK